MAKERTKSIFDNFTRQFSLQKTLRFELKPIGKTRKNMNMNANLGYDKNLRTFLADQEIEDAYQILKPVFDKIHEEFITKSLESAKAKEIDFSEHFNLYGKQKAEQDKNERKKLDKPLRDEEKKLRKEFEKLYIVAGEEFKTVAGKDDKNKDILKENGCKVLTEAGILTYLKKKLKDDSIYFDGLKLPEVKVLVENNKTNKEKIEKALEKINKFFTYFGGFNKNRENYYSTDEKATAVASRVVDENLPKFIDNLFSYEKNKDEYGKVFAELKNAGKELKLKNPKWDGTNKIAEFIPAYDIKDDEANFAIESFANYFSQPEIDAYNEKVANVNYLVNLHYQQTKNKLPKFKILFKQIGCGEKKDFIKSIKDNAELKAVLEKAKLAGEKYFINDKQRETVGTFMDYLLNLDNFENIFWSDKAINTISGKYFGNWGDLKEKFLKAKVFNKDKNNGEAKVPQAVGLSDLFEVLDAEKDWREEGILFRVNFKENSEEKQNIIRNAQTPHEALLKMVRNDIETLAQKFIDGADEILKIEEGDYQKDESKIAIKAWLDNALFAGQILKYWKVKARYSVDGNFTDIFDKIKVSEVVEDYDVVRNYLTQKPQNKLGKLKLNFENSSIASGWDVNKEKDNSCVILRNEKGKQYLAIIKYKDAGIFEQDIKNPIYVSDNSGWTKMNYKLIPGPNKMLPKVLFSSKWIKNNPTPDNIKKIYDEGTFKKGDDFDKNDLRILIDFYKNQLKKYPSADESWDKLFDFNFSDTKNYEGIDQFYTEVEKQGYNLEFVPVNKSKIDELVDNGTIYLFEIKSKDNNLKDGKEKTSAKDLQTIYWDSVFEGAGNKPKLNGGAEIFYRVALEEKDLKRKEWKNKEIVENFRFSKERFIFHCPITLNPCLKNKRITDLVNENVIKIKSQLFLGIDRGEKHLAYYSLVNQKGEILEQGSFNEINGQNYWEKLDKKQGDRDLARKNWTTIGNIKDLKDGYISQVVRKIVDLAVYNGGDRKKGFRETPAFIVLEDLNIGFKRGRQKIEKQVYQKLELALAKKLNFLVDKGAKAGETASVDNALQLTPPVRDFGDMKSKQFGIMLYVNPGFTSVTDPIKGWHKTISIKKGSEKYIRDQIMDSSTFTDFGFDGKDYYFKYKDANTGKGWTLYSGKNGVELDRYRDKFSEKEGKKHWNPEKIEIVKNLEKIFNGFDQSKSFKEQIKDGKELNKIDKDRTAWESLRFVIDVIQQIRNTGKDEKDNDFILSPVREANGDFFDSRKIKNGEKLPQNGDANGAYNIARKGIIMSEHIKKEAELFVRNEEWDAWLAGEKTWGKYMAKNLKIRKKLS
jgi:hypothetical protein